MVVQTVVGQLSEPEKIDDSDDAAVTQGNRGCIE